MEFSTYQLIIFLIVHGPWHTDMCRVKRSMLILQSDDASAVKAIEGY